MTQLSIYWTIPCSSVNVHLKVYYRMSGLWWVICSITGNAVLSCKWWIRFIVLLLCHKHKNKSSRKLCLQMWITKYSFFTARQWSCEGSDFSWVCLCVPMSTDEVTVQDMFKLVHYAIRTVGIWVVGIRLKCLLVTTYNSSYVFTGICQSFCPWGVGYPGGLG